MMGRTTTTCSDDALPVPTGSCEVCGCDVFDDDEMCDAY